MEREKNLRIVRTLVAEADAEFARGDVFEWTPTSMDEVWAEADEEDRLGVPIPDHVKP